jgi:ProP effector
MTDTLPEEFITAAAQVLAPNALPDTAPEAAEAVAPVTVAADTSTDAPADAPRTTKKRKGSRPQGADSFPVLEKLAALYPKLFGAVFLPLKRGIFQDLMAAHPDVLEREALKGALALHTRSTRYLTTVAAGEKRHDLQDLPVEDMAPEHVYQSLLEVFRRRHNRAGEDVRPALRKRILQAFEASGMSKDAYVELVRGRDEAANTVLEEALAEAGARAAKDEALLRAFAASGQTVEAFADMYGMEVKVAGDALERARRLRPLPPKIDTEAGIDTGLVQSPPV